MSHPSVINSNQVHQLTPFPTTTPIEPNDDLNPDLFWLPARLHPEIAPQEFKAFIQEATKPENLLRRTNSALGSRRRLQTEDDHTGSSINSGLGRKKSMLSKVYDPTKEDRSLTNRNSEHPPIARGYSMSSRGSQLGRGSEGLESLTINDLQRLESLVLSSDTLASSPLDLIDSSEGNVAGFGLGQNRIQAVLRRSLSMGGAAALSSGDDEDSLGEITDDSPLISRGPGHIIRRTARTKVRKSALLGDGGGHRFPATRRTKIATNIPSPEDGPRSTSMNSCTSEDSNGAETLHPNGSKKPLQDRRVSDMSVSTEERSLDDGSIDDSHDSHAPRSTSSASKSTTVNTSPTSISDSLSPSTFELKPTGGNFGIQSEEPLVDHTLLHQPSSRPISCISNSSLLDAYLHSSTPSTDDGDSLPPLSSESIDRDLYPTRSSYPPNSLPQRSTHSDPNPLYSSMASSEHLPLGDSSSAPPQKLTSQEHPPPQSYPGPPVAIVHPTTTTTAASFGTNIPAITNGSHDQTAAYKNAYTKSMDDLHAKGSMGHLPRASTIHESSSATPNKLPNSGQLPTPNPRPLTKSVKTSPPKLVSSTSSPPPPLRTPNLKETKEKKRPWAKLGLSSSSSSSSSSTTTTPEKVKKGKSKEKTTPSISPPESSATKKDGFLSGLFGGGKSKKTEPTNRNPIIPSQPQPSPQQKPVTNQSNVPIMNQKPTINPTASGGFIKGRYTSFYRLPIHVERAVYRLSHIKLANPRRPLYEQVLISNLMFWYLGVINKTQQVLQNSTPPQNNPNQSKRVEQPPTPTHKRPGEGGSEGFDEDDESGSDEDEDADESSDDEEDEDDEPNEDTNGMTRRVPGSGGSGVGNPGVSVKKKASGGWLSGGNRGYPHEEEHRVENGISNLNHSKKGKGKKTSVGA